jgi:RNA polymerase sigma-70 factor (sigma-E family)
MRRSTDLDFTEFVVVASARLFRTAYAVSGDRQLAEDAVQAGLVSAYASWSRVAGAKEPEAYVRRIVINQLFAWHRRAWNRREVSCEVVPEPPNTASLEDQSADAELIWQALRELPARQRAVVVLRYVEDLSERETAELLGIRPGTVKSQAARGLAHLRALLDEPAAAIEAIEGSGQ